MTLEKVHVLGDFIHAELPKSRGLKLLTFLTNWVNCCRQGSFFNVLLTVHLDILCNENNWMRHLSSINFVIQPLLVSGIFIAHHKEVFTVYARNM
jgi:hypothetical protein